MPYQYKYVLRKADKKHTEPWIAERPIDIFDQVEGPDIEYDPNRERDIFDRPVIPEEPEIIGRQRQANPDENGAMWAMGKNGPYIAYRAGANTPNNLIARWNAEIGARGDFFIDPPRNKKKVQSLRSAWQALNRR